MPSSTRRCKTRGMDGTLAIKLAMPLLELLLAHQGQEVELLGPPPEEYHLHPKFPASADF